MKLVYREEAAEGGEDIYSLYKFDRGETLTDDMRRRIIADVERALAAHGTTIIIASTMNQEVTASPASLAPLVIREVLTSNKMKAETLAELTGTSARTFYRWLNGSTERPGAKICRRLLQLHHEGRLKLAEDSQQFLRGHSQRNRPKIGTP